DFGMSQHYYIEIAGAKDGPHDLVTLMRRIRAGKIAPHTQIYKEGEDTPLPASKIEEIAPFFEQSHIEPETEEAPPSLFTLLQEGWRFTFEHNIMTVFAGGMLLVSFVFALLCFGLFPPAIAAVPIWIFFIILHNLYLIFVLRLYRGQT